MTLIKSRSRVRVPPGLLKGKMVESDWRTAVRDLLEIIRKDYGEYAYIEFLTDGSGTIYDGENDMCDSFDGLGELAEILK